MAKAEYKTQTRQMILDYMVENPDRIFKASEIAESLPQVSLSTIYRNLSRLQEAGMLVPRRIVSCSTGTRDQAVVMRKCT